MHYLDIKKCWAKSRPVVNLFQEANLSIFISKPAALIVGCKDFLLEITQMASLTN